MRMTRPKGKALFPCLASIIVPRHLLRNVIVAGYTVTEVCSLYSVHPSKTTKHFSRSVRLSVPRKFLQVQLTLHLRLSTRYHCVDDGVAAAPGPSDLRISNETSQIRPGTRFTLADGLLRVRSAGGRTETVSACARVKTRVESEHPVALQACTQYAWIHLRKARARRQVEGWQECQQNHITHGGATEPWRCRHARSRFWQQIGRLWRLAQAKTASREAEPQAAAARWVAATQAYCQRPASAEAETAAGGAALAEQPREAPRARPRLRCEGVQAQARGSDGPG
jgi:hypothetical protein